MTSLCPANAKLSSRRTSLPAVFNSIRSPTNNLSPRLGYLKEISEFEIDPPFLSPASSSSRLVLIIRLIFILVPTQYP